YKLTFNGFSPSRTYVEIKHKGQYVISITYVEKDDTPKEVRQE
ncbi:YxeA family protein, partial [Staphylococcus aureus]